MLVGGWRRVDPRWKKSLVMVRFGPKWVDPRWWVVYLLLLVVGGVVDFKFNEFFKEGCCG
jgi:hypothetical protein